MFEIDEILAKAKKDGLLLRRASTEKAVAGCHLGGLPNLPDRFDWPHTSATRFPPIPLHFIAQIDLASLPATGLLPQMPKTGTLFFFLDPIFGPTYEYDCGTAVVLYAAEDVTGIPERVMPKIDFEDLLGKNLVDDMSCHYRENPAAYVLEKQSIEFLPRVSYDQHLFLDPDYSDPDAEEQANLLFVEQRERLEKLLQSGPMTTGADAIISMFAGASSPGRLIGGSISYEIDMVPLLTVETDYRLGLMLPGECVAFWIGKKHLAEGDFNSVFAQESRH